MSSRMTVDTCSRVAPPMHSARLRHGKNRGTRPTFDALAKASRFCGLLSSSMPWLGYFLCAAALDPFMACVIHVESACKFVHVYACPDGPKAW
eukprot:4867988-Pyramimonas_sp.AAC.1